MDRLMYQFWKPDSIEQERERIYQTWFDYRHVHPVMRSFIYMRAYERAHQKAFKRFFGAPKEPGLDLPSTRSLYTRKSATIRRVIVQMHVIDELGIPYPIFMDAAFEHFMQERAYTSKWREHDVFSGLQLPPVTSIVDTESTLAGQKAFVSRNSYDLQLPQHPHYHASNWVGSDNQKDFALTVMKRVQNSSNRDTRLAKLVYHADRLREVDVARRLGLKTVKNIRAISKRL